MFMAYHRFRQIPLAVAAAGLLSPHPHRPCPQRSTHSCRHRRPVHIGHFLATLKPVLTIDSGDTVTIESTASIVPSVVDASGVMPASAVPQYQRDIYGTVQDRGPGPHVLTGPIAIRSAMPGDVLEVRILAVELALDGGYNRHLPEALSTQSSCHVDDLLGSVEH